MTVAKASMPIKYAPFMTRAPTIYEIAEKVGVSVATVSRVLSGVTGKRGKKKEEILEVARQMGYRPNKVARNLVNRRSHMLGFLASDLNNHAYVTYYHAIENFFRPRGYEILIADSERSAEIEAANIERMLDSRVDGLIIFPVSDWDIRQAGACAITYSGIPVPVVILGKPIAPHFDHVYPDDGLAARLLARHLTGLKHRRCLVLISGRDSNPTALCRLEAFTREFSDSRCKVRFVDYEDPRWAEACMEAIRGEGFTALVGVSHIDAAFFNQAAWEHGLQIPRDVSIVAFDDGKICELVRPAITCTKMDHIAAAGRAAALMAARLEPAYPSCKPARIAVPYELIVRASTTRRQAG